MEATVQKVSPAQSSDTRWKLLTATMRRHGNKPDALIEALHTAQEAFGFIDEDAMRYVAEVLRVPLSKVYGVATFYHYFTLKPQGDHTCVVCTGTACYIKGAATILKEIEKGFGVGPGETTEDRKLSILTARCFGCCGLAPAAVIDGETHGKLDPTSTVEKLRRLITP
jgi:bidirectional [NiFe] hydrogenase diaphorase subunit